MSDQDDIALMAHLMRRAGFGATRGELESLVEVGYENVVEQLLHPKDQPDLDMYPFYRYMPQVEGSWIYMHVQTDWLYRMRNGHRPLQEKMALFWHQVFATGASKVGPSYQMAAQIDLFREKGMGNYRERLGEIARNPAMIFWLDNQDNHKRAPNENWGRELLELFSLGVGNYTEKDVYECSRAFTGLYVQKQYGERQMGPVLLGVRLPAGGPRQRREDLSGAHGRAQWRGLHRPAARLLQVHRQAPLQLLHCRRASGASLVD